MITASLVSMRLFAAGGLITPPLSPVAGGLNSNQVYTLIQQFAPTNGGITAPQAAVLINDTNVNRIQPVVDGKLAVTNSFLKTNGAIAYSLTITNGKDIRLDSEGAGVSRIISSGITGSLGQEGFIQFARGTDATFYLDTGENNNLNIRSDGDAIFRSGSYSFGSTPFLDANGLGITNLINGSTVSAGANVTVTQSKNVNGSTNYQVAASGTGSGTLLPPNALGVLTNNGTGSTNWSTSIPFTWVPGGQTAIDTSSNLLRASLPDRTNFYNVTNAAAGNAVVVVGPDAGNNFWLKGTNWPTGTTPNGLVTNVSPVTIISTNSGFISTNANTASFNVTSNSVTSVQTNGLVGIILDPTIGISVSTGTSNYLPGFNWSTNNSSPVVPVAHPVTALVTNTTFTRAQLVVKAFTVSTVTGIPIITFSNQTTGIKLDYSRNAIAQVQTNWYVLPTASRGEIIAIRDESAGTGASSGVITNLWNPSN